MNFYFKSHLSCHAFPVIEKVKSLLPPVFILDLCHLLVVCIVQDDVNLPSPTKTQSEEALSKKVNYKLYKAQIATQYLPFLMMIVNLTQLAP